MIQQVNLRQIAVWLPSAWVACFFIDNAFHKIIAPAAELKQGISDSAVMLVGLGLAVFVTLFLRTKTMVWGAFALASYMGVVLVLHLAKGKPFLLTVGVLVLILAAVLVRSPQWLTRQK